MPMTLEMDPKPLTEDGRDAINKQIRYTVKDMLIVGLAGGLNHQDEKIAELIDSMRLLIADGKYWRNVIAKAAPIDYNEHDQIACDFCHELNESTPKHKADCPWVLAQPDDSVLK